MRIGYHLTPFWSPAERGVSRVIDEAIDVISLPPEPAARIEYLQMISEEIVAKVLTPD